MQLALYLLVASLMPTGLLSKPTQSHHKLRHHKRRHIADAPADTIGDMDFKYIPSTFPSKIINETKLRMYREDGCAQCIAREGAKYVALDSFLSEILNKLGMDPTNIPQISADDRMRDSQPIRMILNKVNHNYGGMQSDQPDDDHLKPVDTSQLQEIWVFAKQVPSDLNFSNDLKTAYFEFTNETVRNSATEAQLTLYVLPTSDDKGGYLDHLVINIYRRSKDGRLHRKVSAMQKVKMNGLGGWVTVDVKHLVKSWFNNPEHNYGIYVEVLYQGNNLAVHPQDAYNETYQMYLHVKTLPRASAGRSRRSLQHETCYEDQNVSKCCRYQLEIDFREIGWDWVIAPTKYTAYFCNGDCPTNHLQQYIHTHLTQGKGSCCHPTSLSSLTMVYLDSKGDVLVSNVPGMTAKTCGCA